jgi:enoyl-CoA hydratase/carnithine racemase
VSGHLELRREGATWVVVLNRDEKLNAISSDMERELLELAMGEELRSAGCVVFAGAGRAFSAGADIGEFQDLTPERIAAYYATHGDVYERIGALPVPTIAAIHGWCLGGGLELALAADFRLPEVELGILPSSGGLHRLVRLVGPARAKELMLLRDRFDAAEADRLGLLTEVAPAGRALDRALELAAGLVERPALAASVVKQAADAAAESSRAAGVLLERFAYGMLAQTDEALDAARAFTARRRR